MNEHIKTEFKKAKVKSKFEGKSYPMGSDLKFSDRVSELGATYNFTESQMAEILDVSTRTITRWKAGGEELSLQKKDSMYVLETILDLGKTILGSTKAVEEWLNSPVLSLDGKKPIDVIATESGRRKVENVLYLISAGAF